MVHSFLLIGQSNAAGRGFLADAEPLNTCNGRLKMQRNGLWIRMSRPVNPDRSFSGTCLAESFAKAYADEHPDVDVGIIPCADGGTIIEQWQPGEILFDNAVNCARLAMRTSSLRGILWHQGEGDCLEDRCLLYEERFFRLMDALRGELGLPKIPIIVGGLGDFLAKCELSENIGLYYEKINEVLERLGREYPHCAFVPATGLGANPDNLHFSAAALQEFGLRYYEAFRSFDCRGKEENDCVRAETERSAMELL